MSGKAPVQRAAWVDGEAPGGRMRLGEPLLVKGGARVSFPVAAPEAADEGPAEPRRTVGEAEVEAAGLFRERTFEIGETSEQAVVSKPVAVREALVVRRDVETRMERIRDRIRRTEVEVERRGPG